MVDFFIALFGLTYYGGVLSSEKAGKKRYEHMKFEKKRDAFREKYCNMELEDKLRPEFRRMRDDRDFEYIKKNLENVFGENYKEEFGNMKENINWIRNLVMSRKGYIPGDIMYPVYLPLSYDKKDIQIRLLRELLRNIREAGYDDFTLNIGRQSCLNNFAVYPSEFAPEWCTAVFE